MRYAQLIQGDLHVPSLSVLSALGYLEVFLCVAALCLIVFKKHWADYSALGSFLLVRIVSNVILTALNSYAAGHPASAGNAYKLYFYSYWISFAVESVLALLIVYSVFRLAMAPLKGLQTLGMLVFKVGRRYFGCCCAGLCFRAAYVGS